MILKKLNLQNFRNCSKKVFEFSDKVNLIVGPNAAGKTNILEAIYFLATGRSFRVKLVEREAIRYGEEIARITGNVGEEERLEIVLTAGEVGGEKSAKKKYQVNGVGKRQVDFLGNLRAVYFGPEDLELVTDSPGLRRRYLEAVLSSVDREYLRASLSYEKGLRSRNRLLEEMKETQVVDRRRLYFWNQLLIKNGNYITKKRTEFIDYLNNVKCTMHNVQFKIEYDPSAISEERLVKYSTEEIAAGVTLVGPHRDNFKFQILQQAQDKFANFESDAERDLAVYGSRGEQRLAILWLKLGELAFVEEKTNSLPILLLDDIFSELDVLHRKIVFDLITGHQTIITTADLGMVGKEWLKGVNIINLTAE